MNDTQTSHCFPLNGKFDEPEIRSIDGILNCYKKNVRGIYMAGPTFFSSVMDVFMDFAMEGRDLMTYFVLLILTDGEIHDMLETKRMIVEASKLPCSIIIVGVGNEDFEMMVELDSDDKMLKDDKNKKAKRDIVQFVRFQEAIARGNLGEEVLKEIPGQVCRYMEQINFAPKLLEPNFEAINRTINRQRDAMMARAGQKDPVSDQATPFEGTNNRAAKIAEGGPEKPEVAVAVKKRRGARDAAGHRHAKEPDATSDNFDGAPGKSSKERGGDRKKRRNKDKHRKSRRRDRDQAAAQTDNGNALDAMASSTKGKGGDPDAGNL